MNNGLYPNGNGRFTSREFPVSQNSLTIEVMHGLGAVPRIHKWVLVCKKTEAGYAPGDEADVLSCRDSSVGAIHFCVSANGSICRLVVISTGANSIEVFNISTQAAAVITASKWAFKCYAAA